MSRPCTAPRSSTPLLPEPSSKSEEPLVDPVALPPDSPLKLRRCLHRRQWFEKSNGQRTAQVNYVLNNTGEVGVCGITVEVRSLAL